jgi:ABC-type molybdate transport system substrate-binding protein
MELLGHLETSLFAGAFIRPMGLLGLNFIEGNVRTLGDVPITKYANQLVDNLAKVPGYPANYAAAYKANIASKEDNVKAVVAKLELGEGDAAIVYVTDAKASTKVRSCEPFSSI